MSNNFIEELKERNNILEVAKELVSNLKKTGRAWQGTVRDEKTPALTIYPDNQSWCHFAGDTTPRGKNGGDVIALVEYIKRCSPREAMEFLAERSGLEMRRLTPEEQQRVSEEKKAADEDAAILERLVSLFEQNRDKAVEYLKNRGINSELIEKYRIGWADHSLETLRNELQDFNAELVSVVLSNPSFFINSVIIPIVERGRIVALYSRSNDRQVNHLYLSRHPKGIFNHDEALAIAEKQLYLAEAPIDALSAIQHGIKNIVAFGGCKLSEEQRTWIRKLHDIEIVTCFDNDSPGYEATKVFMSNFSQAKMKTLPPGDLNDFFQEHTQDDFEKLEVKDWYTVLLQEINIDTPKESILPALKPLFAALAESADLSTAEIFIRHRVKNHFKITARDVESCIRSFKELREEILQKKIENENKKEEAALEEKKQMTAEEKAEAEEFLKNTDLIEIIQQDLTKLGVVGENKNKVALYIMCTTRKMDKPINSTIRASSGIGKSNMASKVLSCMPEEDVIDFTRITSKYLDYVGEYALQYKILSIAERAGTEDADYSIRMVEDDTNPGIKLGYLKKDPKTGEVQATEKTVRGPTMLLQTTTKLEMNPENESREFPVYLDESEKQRKDVHNYIKKSKLPHATLREEERNSITNKHKNAQRLLQSIPVAIPFSELIDLPTKRARSSRDLKRLLGFIEGSALTHQYQRPRMNICGKEYLLTTLKDYEIAYDLLDNILEDALSELNPTSEQLLEAAKIIQGKLGSEDHFTRTDLRKELKWEKTKIARAVEPLETAGYFDIKQKGNAYTYRLIFEDEVVDVKKGTLSPNEFFEKVYAELDTIDPIYGTDWLDKKPVHPVQVEMTPFTHAHLDQDYIPMEEDISPQSIIDEYEQALPMEADEQDREELADYILTWGEKHNYPTIPLKFNNEDKPYLSLAEGKDHWHGYVSRATVTELEEVRYILDKQS